MTEEQVAEKIQAEENKFMMILASGLALVWIILILIGVFGGGVDGSIYFLYGLFNIGAFIFYNKSRNKRAAEKWIKTNLFEDMDEKKANEKSE